MHKEVTLKEIYEKCDPKLLEEPINYHDIAAAVNVNRTTNSSLMVSERRVRLELGPVLGSKFMRILKELKALAESDTIPEWLTNVLTIMNINKNEHIYYLETLGCAYDWLKSDAGIDIGTGTVRSMLDIIGFGNPELQTGVDKLKSLAPIIPDEVSWDECYNVMNGV